MFTQRFNHGSQNSFSNRTYRYLLSQALIIVSVACLIIAFDCLSTLAQTTTSTEGSTVNVTVNVPDYFGILGDIIEFLINGLGFGIASIWNFIKSTLLFLKDLIQDAASWVKAPFAFINLFINGVIDRIAVVLPSTPNELKVSNLVESLDSNVPVVGKSVIAAILNTFIELAGLALVIKIYKLIPFKAT